MTWLHRPFRDGLPYNLVKKIKYFAVKNERIKKAAVISDSAVLCPADSQTCWTCCRRHEENVSEQQVCVGEVSSYCPVLHTYVLLKATTDKFGWKLPMGCILILCLSYLRKHLWVEAGVLSCSKGRHWHSGWPWSNQESCVEKQKWQNTPTQRSAARFKQVFTFFFVALLK